MYTLGVFMLMYGKTNTIRKVINLPKINKFILKIKNKKQRHDFGNKGLSSKGYGISRGQVWIESWTIKKLNAKKLILLNCGVGEES